MNPETAAKWIEEADYVLVGAGSTDRALAARLDEDPDVDVTSLEAGPRDRNRFIGPRMPAPKGLAVAATFARRATP
jgi:choline dehydrogenase